MRFNVLVFILFKKIIDCCNTILNLPRFRERRFFWRGGIKKDLRVYKKIKKNKRGIYIISKCSIKMIKKTRGLSKVFGYEAKINLWRGE